MQVRMDSPNKLQKYKKYISTKVLITQSFLELQTPDFAWKFICTVQPNEKVQKVQKYKSTKSTKKHISTKLLITQSFLELQTPDFAWKFLCTVQPNEKVQKYKK